MRIPVTFKRVGLDDSFDGRGGELIYKFKTYAGRFGPDPEGHEPPLHGR